MTEDRAYREIRRARFDGDEAVAGLAWTADSRALVFGTGSALWMLPVPDFTSTAVDKVSMIDTRRVSWRRLRDTRDGLRSTSGSGGDEDIWRMRIPQPSEKATGPVRLIASSRRDFAQPYSPDGQRIAFESPQTGNLEIWVCEASGTNCNQVTSIGAMYTGLPTVPAINSDLRGCVYLQDDDQFLAASRHSGSGSTGGGCSDAVRAYGAAPAPLPAAR